MELLDIVVIQRGLTLLFFLQKPYEEPQPQMQVQEQLPQQEQVETGRDMQEANVAATDQVSSFSASSGHGPATSLKAAVAR